MRLNSYFNTNLNTIKIHINMFLFLLKKGCPIFSYIEDALKIKYYLASVFTRSAPLIMLEILTPKFSSTTTTSP